MPPEKIKLGDIAHARSGDKGNHANVAVLAYTPAGFSWLRRNLTARVVADFFRPKLESRSPSRPSPAGAGEFAQSADKGDRDDVAFFFPHDQRSDAPRVERFEAANVIGLNFMLYEVLGGGASRSLDIDSQGKTLAVALLQMELPRPVDLEAMQRPRQEART
jgi:hypothetical protein